MLLSTILIVAGVLMAEAEDSIQAVTVVADKGIVVSRTDTLKVNPSQTITELLCQSPGAYVGDNGGYAGLKSVNIRGMGSQHTAIYVDGIRVGNVQNGQSNLGILGLENYASAVIDYAQNSLSFATERPSFIGNRKLGGKVIFSAGSFGTYLPSARLDWRISEKLMLSANADAVFSKGNFGYGDGLSRENNDISEVRTGLDLFGSMDGGDYHVKAWYHGSDRGTPGTADWPSTDRQTDKNAYVQGLVRKQFSGLYQLTASAKLAYDDIFYTSSWGNSQYGQTEAQLNSSHKFSINRWLTLSVAADVYWDGLNSNVYSQQRLGTTESVTAAIHTKNFRAGIAVQYDGVFDRGQSGRNCISPSLDLRYKAFDGFDLVAFARRAYRVPTFNELYYTGYGNPELKPEDAYLSDIGIDWKLGLGRWKLKAKVDGYFNYLQNKIVSAPSPEDPNIWRPYNIEQVRSAGVDAQAGFDYSNCGWLLEFSAKYVFQGGTEIPYAARHNLSLNASADIRGWSALAVWNLRAGRRDGYGEMPDWNTLDLYFSKTFELGKAGTPMLKLALKNITDYRYELAGGYPMPGFSITGGIEYKF